MAARFEFYLSDEDTDRLFAIKNLQEKETNLTGNEFARKLLESVIHQRHPKRVRYEEESGEMLKLRQGWIYGGYGRGRAAGLKAEKQIANGLRLSHLMRL